MPPEQRERLIRGLTDEQAEEILNDWTVWARSDQLFNSPDFDVFGSVAGRGSGKTRAGAEWVRDLVKRGYKRVAFVAPTIADVRDVMVEGESGLLSVCWEKDRDENGNLTGVPLYEPSKRHKLTWANGAVAYGYSAEEPERLRGPQHDAAWCDELAAWRYLEDSWDMLNFGLRLGNAPKLLFTTTPKPIKLLKELLADPNVLVTTASTYANRANLPSRFLNNLRRKYENTRLGKQEIYAQILDNIAGALWNDDVFKRINKPPEMKRVVISVDPSGAKNKESKSDEIGIIAAGLIELEDGLDGAVILEDGSLVASPTEWASAAVEMYHRHRADALVAEINYGGAMVESVVRSVDRTVNFKEVHATRGKVVRAEPVAALYEQGRVYHNGRFGTLEDQMLAMTPSGYQGGGSPDRLDAAVWALTELVLSAGRMEVW